MHGEVCWGKRCISTSVSLLRFQVNSSRLLIGYQRKLLTLNRLMMGDTDANTWKTSVDAKGAFQRKDATFRQWVKADGSTPYQPEAGRYHLYISHACPWAHRTMIYRALKGLEDVISVDVVAWLLDGRGWYFDSQLPGSTADSITGYEFLRQIYQDSSQKLFETEYTGSYTVPVLFDKKTGVIVNNESSEIIRMFNSEFNAFAKNPQLDLRPEDKRAAIDELNSWIYPMINNGVYRSGFARSQEAYDIAVNEVFQGLDRVESILSKSRYLTGSDISEADIRLFTTLLRFDPVYHLHFKCNRKRIIDYPAIWGYLRDIYQQPKVSDTINMEHIIKHYHVSHKSINPFSIIPINPILDYNSSHGRENM